MPTVFKFADAQSTAVIGVDPQYLAVPTGTIFTVNINISNVEAPGLYGYDLKLYFNSALLNCTEAVLPADHFLAGGLEIIREINNTVGYVHLVVMLTGIVPGKTGSGILAKVTFSGIGIGTSSLEIKEVTLLDTHGNEIMYKADNGAVKVIKASVVGVKTGDWIKYDFIFSADLPPGIPFPEWMKVEFISVKQTTATARITLHMSDGTEQSQTVTGDIMTGTAFSGFIIPVNSTTGDCIYMGGYGIVTIAGETTRTYAGAQRTVVYANLSQDEAQFTYYWDRHTGILVETSVSISGVIGTVKAIETNIWQFQL